jgi:anti-sigma B factor antagonist
MVPEPRSPHHEPRTRPQSAGPLSIRVLHPAPRTVVVQVAGELDLGTAREFDDVLDSGIGGPVDEVIVDLSGVTFFAVAGLNSLLRGRLLADTAGVHLRVRADSSRAVRRLFALLPVDLDGVAEIPQPR